MKKSALILFLTLLPFMAKAQNTQNSEDGKKIDKEKLESKDYLPEIHGTRCCFNFNSPIITLKVLICLLNPCPKL